MIAEDSAANSGGFTSFVTSKSWTHTFSGNDRIVFISFWSTTTGTGYTVTVNGVAATLVTQVQSPTGNYLTVYYLVAPATGSVTVSVSHASAVIGWGSSISYNGSLQFGAIDNFASKSQAAGPATIAQSLTTVVDKCWVFTSCWSDSGNVPTASTNVTRRNSVGSATGDSNGPVTPAGALSQTWGIDVATASVIIQVSFPPSMAELVTWRGDFPDVILDASVEMVDSGFTPRTPADSADPTPN